MTIQLLEKGVLKRANAEYWISDQIQYNDRESGEKSRGIEDKIVNLSESLTRTLILLFKKQLITSAELLEAIGISSYSYEFKNLELVLVDD